MINTKDQEKSNNRDENGQWVSGTSGNPKGRPPKSASIQRLLDPRKEELVEKAIELALNGDTTALKICIDRIAPTLKAETKRISIPDYDPNLPITDQLYSIIKSIGQGNLSLEGGLMLFKAYLDLMKITEFKDLDERLEKIEQLIESKSVR